MNDDPTLLRQHWLLRNACVDVRLSKASVAVLAVVLDHYSRADRAAYPGFDRIARLAGIHRSSVMRAVDALEAAGYLQVTRQERRANRYTFPNWPDSRAWPSSTGSTGATSASDTSPDGSGSTTARQLVAPVHATGSTGAPQLVAPVRPEPALDPSQPALEPGATASSAEEAKSRAKADSPADLREQAAWIRQQIHYGMIDEAEGQARLRALKATGGRVKS